MLLFLLKLKIDILINTDCTVEVTSSAYRLAPHEPRFHFATQPVKGLDYRTKEAHLPLWTQNRKIYCFPMLLSPSNNSRTGESEEGE